MTIAKKSLVGCALIATFCSASLCQEEEPTDNPRGNVHIGTPIVAFLNPDARFTNFGWGFTVGGGYNFNRRHGLVSEFMWDHLYSNDNALTAIRLAAQDPNINGHGQLFAFTGNYRFELRGKTLGTYFIAGGGLYHRTASLSRRVTTGTNITCDSSWEWWGFSCSSGAVSSNQSIAGLSATSPGVNGGIGFTVRVGDAPYRFYVESRYHYAPTKRINTQLLGITLGIRY